VTPSHTTTAGAEASKEGFRVRVDEQPAPRRTAGLKGSLQRHRLRGEAGTGPHDRQYPAAVSG